MNHIQEQLTALAGIFQAATLVERIAKTGQVHTPVLACLLGTLMARTPQSTLEVFGGDALNLRDGYSLLAQTLERSPTQMQRDVLKYVLALLALESTLNKNPEMLALMGQRLDAISKQIVHFGLTHENVIAAFAALYQDTISTFRARIQVQGEMRFLEQADQAARIRALLLSGIRCARLWHQLGGRRWQLIFKRQQMLTALYPLLRSNNQ